MVGTCLPCKILEMLVLESFPKVSVHQASESLLPAGCWVLGEGTTSALWGTDALHALECPYAQACSLRLIPAVPQHISHVDHSADEGKRQIHEAWVSKAGAHLATLSSTSFTHVTEIDLSHAFQSYYLALSCFQGLAPTIVFWGMRASLPPRLDWFSR